MLGGEIEAYAIDMIIVSFYHIVHNRGFHIENIEKRSERTMGSMLKPLCTYVVNSCKYNFLYL